MKDKAPPTVRDVAARAGVSRMTASRALRGERRVAASTRLKVEQAAAALDYHPNRAASAVMSSIRLRRVSEYRGKIAWIHGGESPRAMDEVPWERPLYEGVRRRSEQSGYLLENIRLNDPQLRPERLTGMLIARGVQGLIVPGFHSCLTHLDWDAFACVTSQTDPRLPPIHLASTDVAHGVRESFAHLHRRGYSRIGLMLHAPHERSSRGAERATYLLECDGLPAKGRIPVLRFPEPVEPAELIRLFAEWFQRHHPDAVICCDEHLLTWTRALGIDVPGTLALVHLNRHPYLTQWAGIDQRADQIGGAAVDLMVGQITRGETGIPPFQKEVLIKGEWVDGSTVRSN